MSNAHKAALEQGRSEGRVVRDYLEALRSTKPKRGRKRTVETIDRRLAAIETELPQASAVDELLLIQERRDLAAEKESMNAGVDLAQLEAAFVSIASAYSQRKGITYATWREFGVTPATLARAGIER
jgi:hypothetical protein